ncbi:MAG TPA: hypothetical protein VLS89_06910 [Candidatus Nanopelagicales bacterium]|nr:hypothetical protein [Candidatus Nanopelagicales bacterium]
MSAEPTSVVGPEFALRLLASRGAAAYFAYLVLHEEVAEVIEEIDAELRALDEGATVKVITASSAARLLQELPSVTEEVILIAAQTFDEADWRRLDRGRSSLARAGVMVFFTTPSSFEELMRAAPNLASWLGGFVFTREDESARVAEQRGQRLAALRAWSGKTDEQVIQEAERGDLPRDPEYAEWVVLLGRGDLLDV